MKVFVVSPLKGNIKDNIQLAITYSKYVVKKGHIPFTPHIYFTQFLDDNKKNEREIGMRMGKEFMDFCDELWIFGKRISEGMQLEIDRWKLTGKPIKHKTKLKGVK